MPNPPQRESIIITMATTANLIMLVTTDARAQCAAQGIDITAGFERLVQKFREADLARNPTFEAALVEEIATGNRVSDFESIVVGRFNRTVNGKPLLHLVLATGDVVQMRLVNA